jgi:type I restriction enzyme M protein
MLSNPPYGKSWKTDLERMGGKKDMRDPRFVIEHAATRIFPHHPLQRRPDAVPGQQALKMKHKSTRWAAASPRSTTALAVHRRCRPGRKQHPPLDHRERLARSHRRPAAEHVLQHRHRHLYLGAHQPQAGAPQGQGPAHRRQNGTSPAQEPGQEELRAGRGRQIKQHLRDTFLAFEETEQSKIFDNARPSATGRSRVEKVDADPIRGRYEIEIDGKTCVVEYEPDSELRDTEQVPLLEEGGIEAFIQREVLPHAPDAWYDETSIKTGYEISFTRYFYKPQPMRSLDEIRADILALEKETEGLLDEILGTTGAH